MIGPSSHYLAYLLWLIIRDAKPRCSESEQDFDIETDRREGW